MTPDVTRTSPPEATLTAGDGTRTANPPVLDTPTVDGDHARPAPMPDAPPGFVIEKELGRGGMGVVYLARQVGLNRPVALKLIQSGDTGSVLRFLAEAEAMAAVRHPNVAEVYQFGEHAGRPFLALEFCPGGDLTRLVSPTRERGISPPRDTATLFLAIAEGVAAAHAVGIVHRDLKPHNVLLTANGTPKVTDFGLAKRAGGSDLTKTTAVMGTPAYMPPEQARGETKFVGPQADVWALGVMLYEALTGTRPFAGADQWAVLAAVQRGTFAAPRAVVADLPRDLELVCLKCLKADPQDRYPTAAELAADLRNWLDGKPISARPAGLIEQAAKWAKRNKRLAVMGAAVLLTMAVATGVSLGFGMEANKQAGIANGEKQKAEQEVERTQRMLAKALMGPISAQERQLSLGVYEQNALWELVAARPGPVPLMLLEEATGSELTAAQFRSRAVFLDHAAVGLDSGKRRQADLLLEVRLRDAGLPTSLKRDVAMAVVSAERLDAADVVSDVLAAAMGGATGRDEWGALVAGLAAVCGRLPAEKAAVVCRKAADALAAALAKATGRDEQRVLAQGLAVVANWLPADTAAGVYLMAAEGQTTALNMETEGYPRQMLVEGLAALGERLPADTAAEVLTAALATAKYRSERKVLAAGLAAVAGRLPAGKAADVCVRVADELTAALIVEPDEDNWRASAVGLAAVAERLPAETAAEVYARVAERLATVFATTEDRRTRRALAVGLAAVCGRLPADTAAGVCGTAADALASALAKATDPANQSELAVGLAAVCGRLPAEKAAVVCQKAADALAAALGSETLNPLKDKDGREDLTRGYQLAVGLAAVCGRLPADTAAGVCGRAADALTAALGTGRRERRAFADGLVVVVQRLTADRAARALGAALGKTTSGYERRTLAVGLAAACGQLPADTPAEVCGRAADGLVAVLADATADERRTLAVGLAAVCGRLPAEKAAVVCRKAADTLAAALITTNSDFERPAVARGLAAVAGGLPADQGTEVLFSALAKATDPKVQGVLTAGLAAVCGRLPADTAAEVCGRAADELAAALGTANYEGERRALAEGLAAATSGLSGGRQLHRMHPEALAAALGVNALHPDALPKPRPLPPQQLVELLKHPFCVKEARRAVLDALEFTYDRKFADLWDFVAFAEKEHPELDLLTPPKRPTPK